MNEEKYQIDNKYTRRGIMSWKIKKTETKQMKREETENNGGFSVRKMAI
jgi:hypothetical protein